jgi:phosphoinositide-3-kinase regulatory subunit 4
MIALDPAQRPSFDVLLHTARGTVLPEAFYAFLHNYVSSVTELPSPSPFAPAVGVSGSSGPSATLGVTSPVMKGTPAAMTADDPAGALPGDSDNRMDKIWTEYESLEAYFLPNPEEVQESSGGAVKIEWSTPTAYAVRPVQASACMFLTVCKDLFPVELHIPGREGKLTPSNDTGRFAADEGQFLPLDPCGPVLMLECRWARSHHTLPHLRQHPDLSPAERPLEGAGSLPRPVPLSHRRGKA